MTKEKSITGGEVEALKREINHHLIYGKFYPHGVPLEFIEGAEWAIEYMAEKGHLKTTGEDAWQDISSAPIDGSWFVVLVPDSPMCWAPYEFASWVSPEPENSYYGADGEYHKNTDGYFCGTDTSDEIDFKKWALLPPAPKHKPDEV